MDLQTIRVIPEQRLKIEVKSLLSTNRKSSASIGTTDDVEWP